MMSTRNEDRLLPPLLAIAIAWLGCVSGPAPRDHYYRLETAAPAALASPKLAGTLEVERLRVETISQGRAMLYRDTSQSGEIEQYAYEHWVDPPSVMLRDDLVRYLREAGVAEEVVTPALRVDSQYLVSGRVVRFECILGGGEPRVVVEIELALTRQEGRELLLLATYREERVAPGSGVADSVTAYEQAIGAIFERFVADIPSS
jgi:cholesterol transport system auxiliary component